MTTRRILLATAAALLSVGTATHTASAQRAPARAVLTLLSSAFNDGDLIPAAHAQPGRDVSPPLTWTGVPDSTRSFVLIVRDLDAPVGDGTDEQVHWLVWNIPATTTSLPAGVPSGGQLEGGMRQISVSGPYYRGPAAPSTGPHHHYVFELYALDITLPFAPTALAPAATKEAVLKAMAGHIRGKGVLAGRYRRPAP